MLSPQRQRSTLCAVGTCGNLARRVNAERSHAHSGFFRDAFSRAERVRCDLPSLRWFRSRTQCDPLKTHSETVPDTKIFVTRESSAFDARGEGCSEVALSTSRYVCHGKPDLTF